MTGEYIYAEGEIAREARRVLRKMTSGGMLIPRWRSFYALISPQGGARPLLRVATTMVEIFRGHDWLAPAPQTEGALVLSDAGLGWLRRSQAIEDPFAEQHQLRVTRTITDDQGVERAVTVNEGESPLGWLHNRRGPDGKKLIGRVQFQAGERLRRDFTLAQMTPRMAVDFSAPVIGGKRGTKAEAPLSDTVLAAKQRVRNALAAVGPGMADLLLDVCCHLIGLADAERAQGWPKRSGKVVLQLALDRLAAHYGMAPSKRGAHSRIRAWAAPEEKKEA